MRDRRRFETPCHAPPQAAPRRDVDTEVLYGLRAGLAVFARRPDDLVEVQHSAAVQHELNALLRGCTARRVAVRACSDVELERFAKTPHHEGLAMVVRARRWLPAASIAEVLAKGRGAAVALDRVRNPYNIGAILRSAAFFGVDVALLGAPAPHPALPSDAVRVAEGGAEHLALSRSTDLAETLQRLRGKGVRVVGADGASRVSVVGYAFARPTVLVFGHEREGLSERVRAQCDAVVAIPGTGAVESLNVAVAAGVMIAELVRPRA